MARLIRPIRQCPQLHSHYYNRTTNGHILSPQLPLPPPLSLSTNTIFHFLCYSAATSSTPRRRVNVRRRGPAHLNALVPTVLRDEDEEGDNDTESDEKRSRNQRKREARRAVRWGMELASFTNDQIKRILRAASLDEGVFDALILVKRLGPDVREGKRRQFNYIGKLLREVQPDLLDTLIHATKHGDQRTLQALADSTKSNTGDDEDDDDVDVETNIGYEAERSEEYISIATKWFDGLISKNMEVTNEVYSFQSVDFDRQELRRLVRKVHTVQEQRMAGTQETEGDINATAVAAEKSLTHFLRALAKQMPSEQYGSP